jgi:hypothetical protein
MQIEAVCWLTYSPPSSRLIRTASFDLTAGQSGSMEAYICPMNHIVRDSSLKLAPMGLFLVAGPINAAGPQITDVSKRLPFDIAVQHHPA